MLFSVPVDLLVAVMIDNIGRKRPDFERIGMSSNAWVGTDLGDLKEKDENGDEVVRKSPLQQVLESASKQNALSDEELSALGRLVMQDSNSVLDEIQYLLIGAKNFFQRDNRRSDIERGLETKLERQQNDAKAKALLQQLNIYKNGELAPLSFSQYFYGTPLNRLKFKIAKARAKCEKVIEDIEGFDETQNDFKDVALMQHFIMEQLPVAKRFSMQNQFFMFDEAGVTEKVNPILWIFVWFFATGVNLYFFYFVLMWGAINGGTTLKAWGDNVLITNVQDWFMIQPMTIFMVYVLGVELSRPQLKAIYRTLNEVATSYIQDSADKSGELRVVQHVSGACRAARMQATRNLASATILRQIDDLDVLKCRQNRHFKMGIVAFLLVAIPGWIAFFDEGSADSFTATLVGGGATAFLLLNSTLLEYGIVYLCTPYLLVLCYYGYRNHLQPMAFRRAQRLRDVSSAHATWQSSKRRRYGGSTMQWVRRVVSRVVDDLSMVTYYISHPVLPGAIEGSEHYLLAFFSNSRRNQLWAKMNSLTVLQGNIGMVNNISGDTSFSPGVPEDLDIPLEILNMQNATIHLLHVEEKSAFDKYALANLLNVKEDDLKKAQARKEEWRITRSDNIRRAGSNAESYRRGGGVTSDPNVALRRMFSSFANDEVDEAWLDRLTDEQYIMRMFDEFEGKVAVVPFGDLIVALNSIWDSFSPGGIPISKTEKKDAEVAFITWVRSKVIDKKTKPVKNQKSKVVVDVPTNTPIKLWEFRLWFLECVRSVTKTRETCPYGFIADAGAEHDDEQDNFSVNLESSTSPHGTPVKDIKLKSLMKSQASDLIGTGLAL